MARSVDTSTFYTKFNYYIMLKYILDCNTQTFLKAFFLVETNICLKLYIFSLSYISYRMIENIYPDTSYLSEILNKYLFKFSE